MFSLDVPLPGFGAETAKEIKKLLAGFEQAAAEGPVRGGVVSEGDAAAYALVWEWGNVRQTKEGPKTVRGMNPDGEEVWLSVQAPFGYIRIHEPEFMRIIEEKLGTVDFSRTETGKEIRNEIKRVSTEASSMIVEILRQVVPKDTGALEESLEPADPDDPDLAVDNEEIELGESGFGHKIRSTMRKLKG